jgi:hypothetical protein
VLHDLATMEGWKENGFVQISGSIKDANGLVVGLAT